jgi:molybdopterin/thiamine biosynthesis adenylyltransferase
LIEAASPEALPILDKVLTSSEGRRAVLLAGPATPKRSAAGGLVIDAAPRAKTFNKARPAHAGFRKGMVPPDIIATRSRLRRTDIQQVDVSWTRLEPGVFDALRDRKVAVLGCGALGGGIARLLAQTGVGRLLLVDPDVLRWENIGRHELGAADVEKNKAEGLALHLRTRLPHLIECDGHDVGWIQLAQKDEAFLDGCDAVVSAMGEWLSESALDDFTRSRGMDVPVIYGWLERRALTAHALALTKNTSCFRCGFDPQGEPLLAATSWFREQDNEQCAAVTSPYGATELACCQSLVSGLVIDLLLGRASPPAHRVWLGRTAELERQGGYWSQRWLADIGDPGGGASMFGLGWPQREGCTCA